MDNWQDFITVDPDLADLRVYPPEDYSGIIVLRLNRQDKRHVLEIIETSSNHV